MQIVFNKFGPKLLSNSVCSFGHKNVPLDEIGFVWNGSLVYNEMQNSYFEQIRYGFHSLALVLLRLCGRPKQTSIEKDMDFES